MNSFYSEQELHEIGFKSFGKNVLISRKCSIYSPEVITIGNNVRVDDFCILSGGEHISIGDYVHIAAGSSIYGGGGVTLEDFVNISGRVTLYSVTDDYSGHSLTSPMVPDSYKPGLFAAPIYIHRQVIIGTCSTVLPGVTIQTGAAIGAYTMVKKDVESWAICVGVPAKKVGERSQDLSALETQFLAERNTH